MSANVADHCVTFYSRDDIESILNSSLGVYEKLIQMHISSPSETKEVPFDEFLDILVNIASSVGAKGHLKLLKSVPKWLNLR